MKLGISIIVEKFDIRYLELKNGEYEEVCLEELAAAERSGWTGLFRQGARFWLVAEVLRRETGFGGVANRLGVSSERA